MVRKAVVFITHGENLVFIKKGEKSGPPILILDNAPMGLPIPIEVANKIMECVGKEIGIELKDVIVSETSMEMADPSELHDFLFMTAIDIKLSDNIRTMGIKEFYNLRVKDGSHEFDKCLNKILKNNIPLLNNIQ